MFRRAAGTDADALIAVRADVGDTTLVDTAALHGINYLYRTDVVAADRRLASLVVDGRVDLPAVDLDSLALDASTATAALHWQPYAGPRFSAYEIWRTRGDERTRIGVETDPADTQFQDAGLQGGVEYVYHIEVVTARDERISGTARSGSIYPLVAEWPLDLAGRSAATNESVRLYVEDGELVALRSHRSNFGLMTIAQTRFDLMGTIRDVIQLVHINDSYLFDARSSALGRRDGQPLLAITGGSGRTPVVLALGLPSRAQSVTVLLDFEAPPALSVGPLRIVAGNDLAGDQNIAYVRDIVIVADGDSLVRVRGTRRADPGNSVFFWTDGNWSVSTVQFDALMQENSILMVQMGNTASGQLSFTLSAEELQLEYVNAEGTRTVASAPWAEFVDIDHRAVSLSPTATGFSATVSGNAVWSDGIAAQAEAWTSLAGFEESHLFTIGNRAYVLSPDNAVQQLTTEFATDVSETRTWSVVGARSPSVGVCMPDADIVHFNQVFRSADWQRLVSNRTVGPLLGDGAGGRLLYPLSMDGSSDGRVYVLDAGNSRVVVLDVNGNYVTHFGSPGSGPGQFDFLGGERVIQGLNYAGSIAVGDDGFIYVADVGNGRIQKFAP